ncbi:MAG: glutathione S-transferase [Myxococcales bacterium]|nr:glutathione S-transferase [Myxococcales bacterium]
MEKKQQAPAECWRLLTIGPSHYCEKARWALERGGLAFQEEAHLPPMHAIVNRKVGARKRTRPVLVTPQTILEDSADILVFVDDYLEPSMRLFPTDEGLRAEMETWTKLFDQKLGPAVRRWLYFHLLPNTLLVSKLFEVPQTTGALLRWRLFFPLMRAVMRKAMNITRDKAERDRGRVLEIFDQVGEHLSDGRRYLVGDQLSVADITFASLAAPVVLAPGYGTWLPTPEQLPAGLRPDFEKSHSHPAAQFVLRLYREERSFKKSV